MKRILEFCAVISCVLFSDIIFVRAEPMVQDDAVIMRNKMASVKLRKKRSFQSQVTTPNTIYVVKDAFDLEGAEIELPDNCVLYFKKGSVSNGTIIGTSTTVLGPKKCIFKEMSFSGSFNNAEVYSQWFALKDGKEDNRKYFDAMMALAKGPEKTSVFIEEGTFYTSVGGHGNGISVPSDTYIYNQATIVAIPTILEKYEIISICNVENVTFEGGQIIGDVGSHLGNTGEWGYGVGLLGARNCVVKDVYITKCWGDGINVQSLYSDYTNSTITGHCYNIRIDNVICDDNRRQGISIEGAIGIEVVNSSFINTGKTMSTLPSTGIDIEPWYEKQVVQNIKIENCRFENNLGGNLICPLTSMQWAHNECCNIEVRNNIFDDCLIRFNRSRNVVFNKNIVGSGNGLLEFNQYSNVSVTDNKIYGSVSFYTEGGSTNSIVSNNTIASGKRNFLNVNRILNNHIIGCVYIQEDMTCVFSNNKVKYEGSDLYSLVCDNTEIEISNNEFELSKPLIFRYKTNAKIHDNSFTIPNEISPACIIMQTARGVKEHDALIEKNTFKGAKKFWVNYSSNGKYHVKDNITVSY